MSNKSLYDIGLDGEELFNILNELEGDISDPEMEKKIDEWLSSHKEDLELKLESYGWVRRQLLDNIEARSNTINNLTNSNKVDENKVKRLENRLYEFFKLYGYDEIKTPLFNFKVVKNGGLTPLILKEDLDIELVPKQYVTETVTKKLNNKKIREELEQGIELEFVSIGSRGDRLKIKQ